MKRRSRKRARVSLATRAHAVYEVAPGLLLVFKPRGHREEAHAHPHAQRLRILRGRLAVRIGAETRLLAAESAPFTIPAACEHSTQARAATWLVAERLRRTRA